MGSNLHIILFENARYDNTHTIGFTARIEIIICYGDTVVVLNASHIFIYTLIENLGHEPHEWCFFKHISRLNRNILPKHHIHQNSNVYETKWELVFNCSYGFSIRKCWSWKMCIYLAETTTSCYRFTKFDLRCIS